MAKTKKKGARKRSTKTVTKKDDKHHITATVGFVLAVLVALGAFGYLFHVQVGFGRTLEGLQNIVPAAYKTQGKQMPAASDIQYNVNKEMASCVTRMISSKKDFSKGVKVSDFRTSVTLNTVGEYCTKPMQTLYGGALPCNDNYVDQFGYCFDQFKQPKLLYGCICKEYAKLRQPKSTQSTQVFHVCTAPFDERCYPSTYASYPWEVAEPKFGIDRSTFV